MLWPCLCLSLNSHTHLLICNVDHHVDLTPLCPCVCAAPSKRRRQSGTGMNETRDSGALEQEALQLLEQSYRVRWHVRQSLLSFKMFLM